MARLTGEAARRWLEQNPSASFTDNTTGQVYGGQEKAPGILENLFMGITKPFRQGAGIAQEFGYTIGDLINLAQGKEQIERPDKYALLSEEESRSLYEDPLKTGLKSGAGIAAYGLPAGGGAATTAGGRIGTAALRGAGAGALGGFAGAEEGEELESILKGAGLGGILGGALQGVGEAAKGLQKAGLSEKTKNLADDLKVSSVKKSVGTAPTMKQGKYDLVRDIIDVTEQEGVKFNSAEELANVSDDILNRYGGLADKAAEIYDSTGEFIKVSDIIEPLEKKMNSAGQEELREPIKAVIDSIRRSAGGAETGFASDIGSMQNTISAKKLLQLRREWGNLGNWNQFTPAKEQAIASVWEDAYGVANDVLEKSFDKVGYGEFRNINKTLKTAIEGKNWARRAMATKSAAPVWTDMTQDAAMFGAAVTGTPGAAISTVASKGLQRYGEPIAEKGIRAVSGVLGGLEQAPGIVQKAAQVAQRGIPAATAGVSTTQRPMDTGVQQVQPQVGAQTQDTQAINMMLADAILQGKISATEANAVMSLLGIGAGGDLSANQSKAMALQNSLDSLRNAWSQASGGAKFAETLGINIGSGTRSLDQAKSAVVEDLGRLQSQGAINKDEREEFERMMPNSWDSEDVVMQKFMNIQNRINSYLQ